MFLGGKAKGDRTSVIYFLSLSAQLVALRKYLRTRQLSKSLQAACVKWPKMPCTWMTLQRSRMPERRSGISRACWWFDIIWDTGLCFARFPPELYLFVAGKGRSTPVFQGDSHDPEATAREGYLPFHLHTSQKSEPSGEWSPLQPNLRSSVMCVTSPLQGIQKV